MSRVFVCCRCKCAWRSSSARVIKKRDRQSGGHRAVSHLQIRDGGIRGMGRPLSNCPHLKAKMLGLATVLRDNSTSALDYSLFPLVEAAQPIRGLRAATRPIDSSGATLRGEATCQRVFPSSFGRIQKTIVDSPSERTSQ